MVYLGVALLSLFLLLIGIVIGLLIAPRNRLVQQLERENAELKQQAITLDTISDENQRLMERNLVLDKDAQELRIENKRLTNAIEDLHLMENRVLGCVTGKSTPLYEISRAMNAELPGSQQDAVMAAIGALKREGLIFQDMSKPPGYLKTKDVLPF